MDALFLKGTLAGVAFVGCLFVLQYLPYALKPVGYLTMYLGLAVSVAVQVIAGSLRRLAALAARVLWLGCEFAFFLAAEWWRGAPEPDHSGAAWDEAEQSASSPPEREAYEEALALLGLTPGVTRDALHRAWKQAIRSVHPDRGGAAGDAQAINAARDLIAARHGWR